MPLDEYPRESLGEYISGHVFGWDIEDLELLATDELSNPEVANIDLLHATMVLGIVG